MEWESSQSVGCRRCHIEQLKNLEAVLSDVVIKMSTARLDNDYQGLSALPSDVFEDVLTRLEIMHLSLLQLDH